MEKTMVSLCRKLAVRKLFYPQPYVVLGIGGCLVAACVPCMVFYALNKREDLVCRLRSGKGR